MEKIVERDTNKKYRYDHEKEDPCFKEQQLSYKCLDDNDYDKEACLRYFVNYQNCRKFWNSVQMDRKRNGIRPILPEFEERKKIKEEFLQGLRNE